MRTGPVVPCALKSTTPASSAARRSSPAAARAARRRSLGVRRHARRLRHVARVRQVQPTPQRRQRHRGAPGAAEAALVRRQRKKDIKHKLERQLGKRKCAGRDGPGHARRRRGT